MDLLTACTCHSELLLTLQILQLPTFMSLLSGEYPATELTQLAWSPCYIASGWTQQKTPPPTVFLLLLAVA
jgi:hypothetical protein